MSNKTEWLYTILANRKKIDSFNQTNLAKEYLDKCNQYDIIIGSIADDKMAEAMRRFAEYGLTDNGLIACLQAVQYGDQYVLKTQQACEYVDILEERPLSNKEIITLQNTSLQKRKDIKKIVDYMAVQYQRSGLYLNEIIDSVKEKELMKGDEYEYEHQIER